MVDSRDAIPEGSLSSDDGCARSGKQYSLLRKKQIHHFNDITKIPNGAASELKALDRTLIIELSLLIEHLATDQQPFDGVLSASICTGSQPSLGNRLWHISTKSFPI